MLPLNVNDVPIVLYIPVLHAGYLQLFARHPNSRTLFVIGERMLGELVSLHQEIRALPASMQVAAIRALNLFDEVRVIDAPYLIDSPRRVITVSESISQAVVPKCFPIAEITVDTCFLRYDSANVKSMTPVSYDRQSSETVDVEFMRQAFQIAERSSDWWRHVGAVLVSNGVVVAENYNAPVPYEQMPYIFGNPRDHIEAGQLSHLSDVLHSEKAVLVQALRAGMSTNGMDLYASVFPCPDCAKIIAYSGIKRCFFGSGHASLDGERILKSQGVELVYVPVETCA